MCAACIWVPRCRPLPAMQAGSNERQLPQGSSQGPARCTLHPYLVGLSKQRSNLALQHVVRQQLLHQHLLREGRAKREGQRRQAGHTPSLLLVPTEPMTRWGLQPNATQRLTAFWRCCLASDRLLVWCSSNRAARRRACASSARIGDSRRHASRHLMASTGCPRCSSCPASCWSAANGDTMVARVPDHRNSAR